MPNENIPTSTEVDPAIVDFIRKVISIEEKYAFEKSGQVNARRNEINTLLEEIFEEN
jgi:hypothetical protein